MRKPSLVTRHSSLVAAAALVVAAGAAAQQLNDPTRPPPGFAVGDPDLPSTDSGAPVLQSIVISPTGRAAIINGEMVKLGQKYRDAVLVRVTESEVTLKSGGISQVLKLYPGVEKRDSVPPVAKAPRRSKAPDAGADPR